MIAVSSFRPMGQNEEWDQNQLAAKASWDKVFEEVMYYNKPEPRLTTPETFFVGDSNDHPTIYELMKVCAKCPGWACLINADIVVTRELLDAELAANRMGLWAMTSWRWQKNGSGRLAVIDQGLDFFAAVPWVWYWASQEVPRQLRIGHPTWDTWMIAFFNAHAPGRFGSITKRKAIIHPIHEGRRHIFNVDGGLVGVKGSFCGMPNLNV